MRYYGFSTAILPLLGSIALFFSCTEDSEPEQPKELVYTQIPDTNFEEALIALNIDSEEIANGKILTSDAAAVTSLDLSDRNISNLTGIEDFALLTNLDVSENKLTTLVIDKLSTLTELDVSGNALTRLDVSKLVVLERLVLNDNPNLDCVTIANNQSVETVVKDDYQIMSTSACENSPTVISIPDANFEQQLIDKGIDSDGQVNQQLLSEDALEVTTLDLVREDGAVDQKIKDLTGIEGFKKLTSLTLKNHGLTEINLTANTLLEELNLYKNELAGLDLSANTALMTLAAGSNNLESIDLSTNTRLESLILFANNLTTIDLNKNTLLTTVDLSVNDLTSISGLGTLTELSSLNLSFNLLEELTVNNTLLELLNVEQNLLKILDVSGAIALKSLTARINSIKTLNVSANRALETLILSANKIETIDLDQNLNLELLWFSSNQLTGIDISKLSKLYNLTVDRNPDLDCIQIAAGQSIPSLVKEDRQQLSTDNCVGSAVDYIMIPDENFERMMVLFLDDSDGVINQKILKSDAEKITTLDLRQSSTANQAVKIRDLTGIAGFINLEKLYLENNLLERIDLSENSKLTTLYLQGNLLTSLDVSANGQLKNVDFSNNQLESIVLGPNANYTTLLLHNNKLRTIDVSAQTSLKDLFLQDNELVSVNLSTSLAHLYLQDNQLTSLDVSALSQLTTLFVKRNAGLSCVKIGDGQIITSVSKDSDLAFSVSCD